MLPHDREVRLGHAVDFWSGFLKQQQCGARGHPRSIRGLLGSLGKLSLTLTVNHLVSLGCSAWGWSPPWHFVSFLGPSLLSVYLLLALLFFPIMVSLRISGKSL